MIKKHTKFFLFTILILFFYNYSFGQIHYQLYMGFTTGDFKDINKWNKRWSGGSDMYKLNNGICGGFRVEYDISSSYGVSFDGIFQYYRSHLELEFVGENAESFGIKDFPIWKVEAVPLSISFYTFKDMKPFRLKLGVGTGIIWARYRELYLHYDAYWFKDIKYNFTGFAPLFLLSAQFEYQLFDKISIIVKPSYQYSKINKLKLSSKENGDIYSSGDVLVDNEQRHIDLNLSGFSITIGIGF